MKENIFKIGYKELPDEIQMQIVMLFLLDLIVLIAGITTSITLHDIGILGYGSLVFIGFTAYVLYFIYFFSSGKAIVINGFISEIDNDDNVKKSLAQKVATDMTRRTFNVQSDDGTEYTVLRTSTKVRKKGSKLRIYTSNDDIFTKSDGSILINRIMFLKVIKK